MFHASPSPVLRLRIGPPGPEAPRPRKNFPHPPSVVEAVRAHVETTRKTYRQIGHLTGVDSGTIARWAAAKNWTRPPGANARKAVPVRRPPTAAALARRYYEECERLLLEVSNAPKVDPAALREALDLLREGREVRRVLRGTRTPKPPKPVLDPEAKAAAARVKRNARLKEQRRATALKGWSTRRSSREKVRDWLMQREGE